MVRLRGQDGFSLIEALVASLVLCVGVGGVLPVVFQSVRATRAARDTSMATWLAWQKLEELRGPADPGLSPGGSLTSDSPGFVDSLDQAGQPASTSGVYTRRWQIEAAPGSTALRVAVAVHHAMSPGAPAILATLRRRAAP